MHNEANSGQRTSGLLTGWKAIAQHFGRTQSTVRRWAVTADLPVYRAAGEKGLSVYAYVDELDAWLTQRHAATVPVNGDQEPTAPVEVPDEAKVAPAPIYGGFFGSGWARRTLLFVLLLLFVGVSAWIQQERKAPVAAQASRTIQGEARELYLQGTYL